MLPHPAPTAPSPLLSPPQPFPLHCTALVSYHKRFMQIAASAQLPLKEEGLWLVQLHSAPRLAGPQETLGPPFPGAPFKPVSALVCYPTAGTNSLGAGGSELCVLTQTAVRGWAGQGPQQGGGGVTLICVQWPRSDSLAQGECRETDTAARLSQRDCSLTPQVVATPALNKVGSEPRHFPSRPVSWCICPVLIKFSHLQTFFLLHLVKCSLALIL